MSHVIKNAVVRCAHSAIVDPRELKPTPGNPNEHPPKQLELFIAILGYQGWRRPITVSNQSGFVTRGHGALEAALLAGFNQVPVDYQDYESKDAELADVVADNQLQRMSEMNTVKLNEALIYLDSGNFNMELTGFDLTKLEKILESAHAPIQRLSGGDGAPDNSPEHPVEPTADGSIEAAPSQVRMVQLFLDVDTAAELTKMVEFFQRLLDTSNLTDTVMEVMRNAFGAHNDGEEGAETIEADLPASE